MDSRSWSCGCASVWAPSRGLVVHGFCSRHQAIGTVSTVLINLAEAKELWAALEGNGEASVRELSNTFYFRIQDAAGRALALLESDRGAPKP